MPRLVRWLWSALMLALPFSSFPLISRTLGVQSVAALSVIFLFILLVMWFLPYLWRGGRLPLAAIPILAFVLVALIRHLWLYVYRYAGFPGFFPLAQYGRKPGHSWRRRQRLPDRQFLAGREKGF